MTTKNEAIYFLNKINTSFLSKEEMIGLLTMAIYSKDIFPSNNDVSSFIEKAFIIKFATYVTKSRTLMCARLTRTLSNYDDKQIKQAHKNIVNFILFKHEDMNFLELEKSKSKKTSNNANKDISKWVSGILGRKKDKS